jgi:hypothetical protein
MDDAMSDLPVVNPVRELQAALEQHPNQLDIDALTSHHFCNGLYARELFIPAGAAVVGKTHAQQNFFVLVKGALTMATPEGPVTVRAPYMVVTQPGDKRAVFALEDSICLNFHPNPDDERDLAVLEDRYITPEALPAPESKELLT